MTSSLRTLTLAVLVVTALISGINLAEAGRRGGPGSAIDRVEAWDTDVYHVEFTGGRQARVVVEGDGDTDLDVYVYDQWGNLVAFDRDMTDYCIVSWRAPFRGTYRIEIINYGDVYNRYEIRTN